MHKRIPLSAQAVASGSGGPVSMIDADVEISTGIAIETNFQYASYLIFGMQILMILLLGSCAKDNFIGGTDFTNYYNSFTGVEIMMFIGFGYLMTFLRRYGMGAVGLTMLVTVLAMQWGMWTEWFFAMWYESVWTKIPLNIITVRVALDQVAALLISFGGLIGKINPLQLVIMTILECVFYSINKSIFLVGALQFIDAGGSIQIHMFGAYFGLAASYILGKPSKGTETEVNIVSDILSLIGTLFLWIYWPSFNGGEQPANSPQMQRAVVHTILALCSATLGTFAVSTYLNPSHKFRPVDIQNATLAGGVAVGATCNLTMNPVDPLIIGLVAGCLSAYGFARIQPILESYGVHDTCGIHNLHGMPSIVGGLASVFICAYKGPRGSDMPAVFTYTGQGGIQLGAIAVTLVIAVASGVFTGLIMRKYASIRGTENFTDYPYWEVENADAEEGHCQKKLSAHGDEEQGAAIGNPAASYDKVDRDSGADLEGEIHTTHVKL